MDVLSYILSKKYIEDSLEGAGALKGKSAYEIACDNGFRGTPTDWLNSLKGDTPRIGLNGTWIIGDVDTGVIASPDLSGYATEDYVKEQISINTPEIDLSIYATRQELSEALLNIKIPDVSDFVTQKEIDDAIAAIQFPEVDLTDYATKEFVQQSIEDLIISNPPIDKDITCEGGEI